MDNLFDFILIYIYFKISLNVTRNFGIKNSSDCTEICNIRILFNRGHNMGCNGKKKKMGSKKFLRISKMGCTLLEIMADGLYAVFHRFEADSCAYYRLTRTLS